MPKRKYLKYMKNNKFNIILILIYLIITIVLMFNHELWRDEAQAWCIVRDLGLIDIFKMSRIEGHPILWYLLLYPFAKFGLPVLSMQIISLLFVFASVVILVFKSPFNYFQKIILCFNAGMLYYLPVVARNYALIPLILFLIAMLWKNRNRHIYLYSLLLIVLSYTHIYMTGVSFVLFGVLLYEQFKTYMNEKNIKIFGASFLLFLNFMVLFLVFNHTQEGNFALKTELHILPSFNDTILLVSQVFVHTVIKYISPLIKYFNVISLVCLVPFIVILYKMFRLNKKIFIIFTASSGFILSIFYFVYFNGILYQKAFLLLLILIFCTWLLLEETETKDKIFLWSFNLLFIISTLVSPFVIFEEIKYNFSDSKQIAQYIRQNLKDEDVLIAFGNPFVYSSISAYLPEKKIYNVISNSYISYYSFKSDLNEKKEDLPVGKKYFIIQNNVKQLDEMGFRVLYESDKKNINIDTKECEEIFKVCVKDD